MPWIPVWFDDEQWFDLAIRFRQVRAVARLEQPQLRARMDLPPDYAFNSYYTPSRAGRPPLPQDLSEYRTEVDDLFLEASREVFQRCIGTTLRFLEEDRKGNQIVLQLPDGTMRRVAMSVPTESDDSLFVRRRYGREAE